jgi:hypothetical protein
MGKFGLIRVTRKPLVPIGFIDHPDRCTAHHTLVPIPKPRRLSAKSDSSDEHGGGSFRYASLLNPRSNEANYTSEDFSEANNGTGLRDGFRRDFKCANPHEYWIFVSDLTNVNGFRRSIGEANTVFKMRFPNNPSCHLSAGRVA